MMSKVVSPPAISTCPECSVAATAPARSSIGAWPSRVSLVNVSGGMNSSASVGVATFVVAARDHDLAVRERRRDRAFPSFGERLPGAREPRERVRRGVEQFRASRKVVNILAGGAARDKDLAIRERRRDRARACFYRRAPSARELCEMGRRASGRR